MDLLDIALTATLVGIFPAWKILKSFTKNADLETSSSRTSRYKGTIALTAGLSVLLIGIWMKEGRSFDALGLASPTSPSGMAGLGVAVVVLLAMVLTTPKPNPEKDRQALEAAQDLLPQDGRETVWFVLCALAAGFSWEILYRGYLIWVLAPLAGLTASILIASTAYALAHGFKNVKQIAGSMVTALVFTISYAISQNLWWLILLHASIPLVGMAAAKRIRARVAQTT